MDLYCVHKLHRLCVQGTPHIASLFLSLVSLYHYSYEVQ